MDIRLAPMLRRATVTLLIAWFFLIGFSTNAIAHPLGNFTINHYARLNVGVERLAVHYVVDAAEISTFQEMQAADTNQDGKASPEELSAYLDRLAPQYADGLRVTIDGDRLPLQPDTKQITTPPGIGNLPTLRVEIDFVGKVPNRNMSATHRLRFEDTNHQGRIGWHEIVVVPNFGVTVFNSSAFGTPVTNELKAYPADMFATPLDERSAELSFTAGEVPQGVTPLLTRKGRPASPARDQLAELITVKELTPTVAVVGLLIAVMLGGLHAFSPGHGKTVVGAYLVGSRATLGHAAFLGLTVTVTHTLGVFALGLVTLFASQYVVPERLFPIISLISGGLVLGIGLSLFSRRLRAIWSPSGHQHEHRHHAHSHDHSHHSHDHPAHETHDHGDQVHNPVHAAIAHHTHASSDPTHRHTHHKPSDLQLLTHSHGGKVHSHLPPGTDGSQVTWRSLLVLGISGGLLPCPSALVVLLSAVSLQRVGFGLLLVVAFSLGLAGTLTLIGLAFVYAGRLIKLPAGSGRFVQVMPVVSAFVITCLGAAILAAEASKLIRHVMI
jgi:ABC-type nickel/cobalt efflux system permease component RcnA